MSKKSTTITLAQFMSMTLAEQVQFQSNGGTVEQQTIAPIEATVQKAMTVASLPIHFQPAVIGVMVDGKEERALANSALLEATIYRSTRVSTLGEATNGCHVLCSGVLVETETEVDSTGKTRIQVLRDENGDPILKRDQNGNAIESPTLRLNVNQRIVPGSNESQKQIGFTNSGVGINNVVTRKVERTNNDRKITVTEVEPSLVQPLLDAITGGLTTLKASQPAVAEQWLTTFIPSAVQGTSGTGSGTAQPEGNKQLQQEIQNQLKNLE